MNVTIREQDAGVRAYRVRLSRDPSDMAAAQRLRHLCFYESAGLPAQPGGLDRDEFDADCLHLLVEGRDGRLFACCRILPLAGGAEIGRSYSARRYDLAPLAGLSMNLAEIGRFCLHPEAAAEDVLRLAWAALAHFVEERRIGMLFGCSSFAGADPLRHAAALAWLARGHLGPMEARPGIRAGVEVCRYVQLPNSECDPAALPPLLRSYLAMGGWVGDHAVIDHELDTLHVFTALTVADVPPARARRLREMAQELVWAGSADPTGQAVRAGSGLPRPGTRSRAERTGS